MKEAFALIFFVALTGTTLYLAFKKKLDFKFTCTFLIVALLGGFGIANYDFVKRFKWLGAEFETFERRVKTVKDEALDEIRAEIANLKKAQVETRNTVKEAQTNYEALSNNLFSVQKSIRDAEFDLLVVNAKADNRHAFDKISSFARDDKSEYFHKALEAEGDLMFSPSGPFLNEQWSMYGGWNTSPLPKTPGENYGGRVVPPEYRPAAINFYWNHTNYTRLQKLDFLVAVITNESSIAAMVHAKKIFDTETKAELDYRGAKEKYHHWWNTNRTKFAEPK
jgi:hypothetical protein